MDKPSYDKSTKEFEIQRISYSWSKYDRKLTNEPIWRHYRYYKTINGAEDAIIAFRQSSLDRAYYDYPGESLENKYPQIRPTITINRYKISRTL